MTTTTHVHAAAKCPTCSKTLSGSTSTNPRPPAPGDITVCAYCGTVLVFADAGFDKLTAEARAQLPADTRAELEAAERIVAQLRAELKR